MPIFLFLFTVLSRLPFTSKYLYHMDSGHFALALNEYDLTLHQPQPPGYFLYVMLGKFLNHFITDPNAAFIFPSILFSALAVVTIYYLAKDMFDKRIGTFAALFAVSSPTCWFHGEVALTFRRMLFSAPSLPCSAGEQTRADQVIVCLLPWFSPLQGYLGKIRQPSSYRSGSIQLAGGCDDRPRRRTEKTFGGNAGKTFLTATISPTKGIKYFAAVISGSPQHRPDIPPRFTVVRVAPEIVIVSGPIDRVCKIYPELRQQWNPAQGVLHKPMQTSTSRTTST